MEILLNKCFGGFELSDRAKYEIAKRKGLKLYMYVATDGAFCGKYRAVSDAEFLSEKPIAKPSLFESVIWSTEDVGPYPTNDDLWRHVYLGFEKDEIRRTDEDLIEVVRQLGSAANGQYADLTIVSIPNGSYYKINAHDGFETCYYSASPIAII